MSSTVPARSTSSRAGLAVTPHDLATSAAIELLAGGGSAVDAAIAANAVQGVVAPETCGIGGDLFALVHESGSDKPLCLNASGRAGSGADAEALRAGRGTTMPLFGPASVTVPGCVDGWLALHDRFGRHSLEAILAPALRHASEGFPASTELSRSWTHHAEQLQTQASAPPLYPDGRPPQRGTMLRRPLLAESLSAVLAGRDAFYVDRIGPGVVEATGGVITPEDLGRIQAEWVEPLGRSLFGLEAWTVPPNTQGYLTLAALAIFEELDAPGDPADPAFVHALIEAYRSVAWERDDLVGDPDRAPLLPADLVSSDRLADRVAEFDPHRARAWRRPAPVPGGTAYLCVVDGTGMSVSLIQSNYHGIGSGLSAGDTGVWLHNRGGGFCLEPGHPNELAPGRRPLHTLSPTIWTRGDRTALLLGTRGGHHQPQYLAQFAAHRFHAGLPLADVQAQPRWAIPELGTDDSTVKIEARMGGATREGLTKRGHALEPQDPWMGGWGPISAIEIAADGLREGVADPRVDTAAAAAC